jgi:hypothetical protein
MPREIIILECTEAKAEGKRKGTQAAAIIRQPVPR